MEVGNLLTAITRDGFTWRFCNGPHRPTALVATYEWDDVIDLALIRDRDDVITARLPITHNTDIFAPETILWVYVGEAHQALQALLDLPHPDHPRAPHEPAPAPDTLHIPSARRCPLTVHPPSLLVAQARQNRLASALASRDDLSTAQNEVSHEQSERHEQYR
ncbi:hypothetical protein SAMN04487905_12046 [Actinopolyspora xinjiangensis]|uniref:Uncharacterized protein n=1 Tax=Actinopolyspora xinjiangensis TaxID=405564 RepID=A0A1H0X0L7_9ACTN|nr:hypothetical protein [Actinopolyspora xinjiangensis]SDP96491.1 hypothetical protein SAMN04487905_12046 [Actinopolyspora xinjiangensis]